MVIKQRGAKFVYNGVKYIIGMPVVGTKEGPYHGLIGCIKKICCSDGKETAGRPPYIYCCFEPLELPCNDNRLEKAFSGIFVTPEMIRPVDNFDADKTAVTIYVLSEDWAVNGEQGRSAEAFTDYEDAKCKLWKQQKNICILSWRSSGHLVEKFHDLNCYECYLDGDRQRNHFTMKIEPQTLSCSEGFVRELADKYKSSCQLEDFATRLSALCTDDVDSLSDEQYQRMIHDPRFPERFQKVLGNNDSYWESYWMTMDTVAKEFVQMYLHENDPKKEKKES